MAYVRAVCLQPGVRKEMISENGQIEKAACSKPVLTAVNNFNRLAPVFYF
jgi:hypothetical protein